MSFKSILIVSKYFFISWKNIRGPIASAFAPEDVKLAQDLVPDLEGINELPFELKLIKLSVGKDGLIESNDLSGVKDIWLDYIPNSLAWPIVSEKLKSTIDKCLTGNEGIDWITCYINSDVEKRTYYILRFNVILDVLDMEKTMFVRGTNHVIKPCFSLQKISKYSIFHVPDNPKLAKITSGLYVNEFLKKAIQKEKITGLEFNKTFVA